MPNTIYKKWCNSKNSYNNMTKLAYNLNLCCKEAKPYSTKVLLTMCKSGYIKIPDKYNKWKQIRRTQSA
jgi:hypothetical protein